MKSNRFVGVIGLIAVLSVTVACTSPAPAGITPSGLPATASAEDASRTEVPNFLACGGNLPVDISTEAVRVARPATELTGQSAAAVLRQDYGPNAERMPFATLPKDWIVVEESAKRVVLLHTFDATEVYGFDDPYAPEFELRVFHIDPQQGSPEERFPVYLGTCTLELPLDGLTVPDVVFDPYVARSPDDTHLDLLVLERACASGESAVGRVELVDVRESDDRIELVIGVRPKLGVVRCPGNPLTPFRVELDAPLGERAIVNAGRFPATELVEALPGDVPATQE